MKRFLTIERAVELIIAIFAVSGVANAAEYLSEHHNPLTAYGLAIALGAVLVASSVMLARSDFERDRRTFIAMLVATLGALALTSAVQTLAYWEEYQLAQSLLFGLGFPFVAECILPVATSVFVASERRKLIREAADHTKRRVAESVAEALSVVDVSRSRAYVERKVDEIVRNQIDDVVREMLPASAQNVQSYAQIGQIEPDLPEPAQSSADGIAQANAARLSKTEQRRNELLNILRNEGDVGTGEFASRLDCSPNTVRNDYSALEEHGYIHRNGNGVEVLG